jgi:hypothetical protein
LFDFLKTKKADWSDIEVSIIVSTGRTGTKFFYSIVNQIVGCLAKHEPKPIGNVEGVRFLKGELTIGELEKFLLKGRHVEYKVLQSNSLKNYFESNGGLTFYVNMLHRIFPKLRIVHIIRDPRDFVCSGCSRVDSTGNIVYMKEENWLIKSNELPKDKYFSEWNGMEMPERFMWIWNLKNEYILNAASQLNHIKTFRFEDLMHKNSSKFEMLNFLMFDRYNSELDEALNNHQKQELNSTKTFLFPEYENWSNELKIKLELHCGGLMKKFNYC